MTRKMTEEEKAELEVRSEDPPPPFSRPDVLPGDLVETKDGGLKPDPKSVKSHPPQKAELDGIRPEVQERADLAPHHPRDKEGGLSGVGEEKPKKAAAKKTKKAVKKIEVTKPVVQSGLGTPDEKIKDEKVDA